MGVSPQWFSRPPVSTAHAPFQNLRPLVNKEKLGDYFYVYILGAGIGAIEKALKRGALKEEAQQKGQKGYIEDIY